MASKPDEPTDSPDSPDSPDSTDPDDDLASQAPGPLGLPSSTGPTGHVAVLPAEVLEYLAPKPGGVILDCTLGRAGHAKLITPHLAPGGRYVGLDVDPLNLDFAREALAGAPARVDAVQVDVVRSNFAAARSALDALGIGRVDGLLADLGFASNQMTDPARGLSFAAEGPLDMRLDPDLGQTAADLLNRLPERELADVIYRYGEEPMSRKIARKVVEARRTSPILKTSELAQLVREAYGGGRAAQSRMDPATRTFMALRIAVNEELGALERLLSELPGLMGEGGRAVIISFHSLEDRLVKHAFAGLHRDGVARRLTPKPVVAGDDERRDNPRSRSAKLRAIEWNGSAARDSATDSASYAGKNWTRQRDSTT